LTARDGAFRASEALLAARDGAVRGGNAVRPINRSQISGIFHNFHCLSTEMVYIHLNLNPVVFGTIAASQA